MAYLDENGIATLSNQLFTDVKKELDNKQEQINEAITIASKSVNGTSLSVRRAFIEFEHTTRMDSSVTTPTDNDYCWMQGGATDGTYIYIAYHDAVYSTTQKVKLVKYDADFNVVKYKLITCNHANDMTYYNGKLYVTSGTNLLIVDPDTLAITSTISKSHTISCAEYYDGNFYVGTQTTCIVYNTSWSEVRRFTFENPIPLFGVYATQGYFIKDDAIYLIVGSNYLVKYDLYGNLIRYYEIDQMRHGVIGEIENAFELNGKTYIGSSTWGATLASYPIATHLISEFDLYKDVLDTNSKSAQEYSGAKIYVNPDNLGDQLADGTEAHPYPYFGFAHREAKNIINGREPGYPIVIHFPKTDTYLMHEPLSIYGNPMSIEITTDGTPLWDSIIISGSNMYKFPTFYVNPDAPEDALFRIYASDLQCNSYAVFFKDGQKYKRKVEVSKMQGLLKINGENDTDYADISIKDSNVSLWCDTTGSIDVAKLSTVHLQFANANATVTSDADATIWRKRDFATQNELSKLAARVTALENA